MKALYSDAWTSVVVNGIISDTPFKVTRGVRQGDPLSCLLFDLAIEPLAEALRQSELKGFKVPGVSERLIATLFADDTVTYLDKDDDFGDLVKILDEWCIASGAKFNINKTETIPIGTLIHRDAVRQTRFVNGARRDKDPRPHQNSQRVRGNRKPRSLDWQRRKPNRVLDKDTRKDR